MCPRPRCDFGDVKLSTQSLGMGFLFWPQMYTKMKTAPQYRTVIALLLLSVFEGSAAADRTWEATVGEDARLECENPYKNDASVTMRWKINSTQIAFINLKDQKSNTGELRYDALLDPGKVYLVIKNVQKKDAGTYICEVYDDRDYQTLHVELLVKDAAVILKYSLAGVLLGILLHILLLEL
ncbi:T-cell surface glycoprotein CD4-like isoform X1 [Acipenser ruthenus]|uniref:T-cell surface glycoprotein CD4-like isoform X1 n=1 Tax=Acipenser ruthenus TaxID=7906 RepID=UPI0027411780|nr:T-cell surface glycoprotein CD4-like isoform X1 [Acipenser ruthenus]